MTRIGLFNRRETCYQPAPYRRFSRINAKPVQDSQTGFIHHPTGIPLTVRPLTRKTPSASDPAGSARIGILFESEWYFKPGTRLELSIPVRGREERFAGVVVFVRQGEEFHETGLWLESREASSRARIVEQICHIEAYLQAKKYREGPYNLNAERVASEWITKYAAEVPGL